MKIKYFFIALLMIGFLHAPLAAENYNVDIHGFISQGYLKTTKNNFIDGSKDGTFQFNEMGINFSNQPSEKLRIGMQFFARDSGSVGNDEVMVDYALADYRLKDFFGVRAGRLKNPMGIYSEYRDIDMLRTSIILPYSVYDESFRESQTFIQGISFYGDVNFNNLGSINYQILLGTNNISPDSSTAISLSYGIVSPQSIELDTCYSYALQYSDPTGHIRLGGTAFFTNIHMDAITINHPQMPFAGLPVDVGYNNIEIYTGSFELTLNQLVYSTELKYSKVRDAVFKIGDPVIATVQEPADFYGYYHMLTYRFTTFLEAGVYYEEYFPIKDDRNGNNPATGSFRHFHWVKKWAFSCKIDLNPNWILKLETQYADGSACIPNVYNEITYDSETNEALSGISRYWWMHAVKLSYNF